MPPPPGEMKKAELYEQVGRAVVELSNAENLLAVIFCILSVPVPLADAKAMFSSQGGFEKKLNRVPLSVGNLGIGHSLIVSGTNAGQDAAP